VIVGLVMKANYSAILYDYRRGGVLAYLFIKFDASTLAEKCFHYIGNTISLLRGGSAIFFFC